MAGFRTEEGNIQDEPGALTVPERKEVLQNNSNKMYKPPLLRCELCIVTFFQCVRYGKLRKKHNFIVEKTNKHYLSQVI